MDEYEDDFEMDGILWINRSFVTFRYMEVVLQLIRCDDGDDGGDNAKSSLYVGSLIL